MPNQSGTIVPNHALRGSASRGRAGVGATIININVNGTTVGRIPRQVGEDIYDVLVDVDRGRGGALFNHSAPALT